MEEHDLQRIGLYDPEAPEAADRLKLLRYLLDRGATEEDMLEAARTQDVGGLALDLVFRPRDKQRVDFGQAARDAGLDPEAASKLFRALGFADPVETSLKMNPNEVEALKLMAVGRDLLGDESTLALVRVMGATAFRLAQALVDSFRIQFELPQQAAGARYSEIVERYTILAEELLPQFLEAFATIFRRHMISIASSEWTFDEEAATARQDLVVGFVDLVGYTRLATTLSDRRLAEAINRFEEIISEIVSTNGGRLVKLVGDGAMFVNENPGRASRTAIEMRDRFAKDEGLLPVRIGLAAGTVVSLQGDYFGDVVNLAARLMSFAEPSTVLVSEELRNRAPEYRYEALPAISVRGLEGKTKPFELANLAAG